VAGDERIRLFCALRLPDDVLDALCVWSERHLSRGRIVRRGNLHVTLAFLGQRPVGEVPAVTTALQAAVVGARDLRFAVRGYRETRSVGMVTLDDAGNRARDLAERLFSELEAIGVYRREARPWLPHVTVLRFRDRPRLEPPLPDLGELSPSDAAVYLSRLRSDGAQYEVLEAVALGG
jgi:RNA 2',3'-cyclic 3'-phosphodiesterase